MQVTILILTVSTWALGGEEIHGFYEWIKERHFLEMLYFHEPTEKWNLKNANFPIYKLQNNTIKYL